MTVDGYDEGLLALAMEYVCRECEGCEGDCYAYSVFENTGEILWDDVPSDCKTRILDAYDVLGEEL